jgi:raffinose/stachyose/melibiose transport system substrate-binding protein
MSRTRRWHLPTILVVMLLALGLVPHASRAQDQKITLTVWDQFTDPAETAAAEAIYKAYTDQNPNVTIKSEHFSTDQIRQTINTALSSGTGPDIIFYDAGPGYAGVLANAGLVVPLDQAASQYGWANKLTAQSLEATSLGGKLYGLPLQVDLIGMYYNKTILDKEGWTVPQTIDDLKNLCQAAKAKGYDPPMSFGDQEGWEAFHQFSMAANAMIGPDAMRDLIVNNTGSWNTPEIVTAIKTFFVDLPAAGCFSKDAVALNYNDANSLFYTETSVISTTGSWLANEITTNMPDQDIGFAPFPSIPGAKGQYWISGVGSAWYISAKSQHQDEAAKVLDYFFSPDVVKQWIEKAGFYVPVQVDVASLQVSPLYTQILGVLQSGIGANATTQFGYNVDVLAPPQFNDAMTNDFQAIINGQKTPEQVAADLDAAWKAGMSGASPTQTPTS